MPTASKVLAVNNDLPIRTDQPVHSGKVRSVYWLNEADSKRLIATKHYRVAPDAPLAVMVISDRISAFDCIWHGEGGLQGVPGKGAALNAISNHWFKLFRENGLADSHILDVPHPLVWIVQKARPIMIEAICRQYITGSMWRSYQKGEREFCGISLPDGLQRDQKLPEILITPSTKGILRGIPGVPEADDVNVGKDTIAAHFDKFNFRTAADVDHYERLLKEGFHLIADALAKIDQIFVDTKFEFGYVRDESGREKMIYLDEVGTPDSSRIWDGPDYIRGKVIEKSKEQFRQLLLNHFPDPDVLLNKDRMPERKALAEENPLPAEVFAKVSDIYLQIATDITGRRPRIPDDAKTEITDILNSEFQLVR